MLNASPEWLTAIGTLIIAALTVISIIILIFQVRDLKKSIHSSTYQHIYELMIQLDKYFIEHPDVKPYFYGGKELKDLEAINPVEREKLLSIAEMMVDYFDSVYHQEDCMPQGTFPKFKAYIKETYRQSSIIQKFVEEHGEQWYPNDFISDLKGEPEQCRGTQE
ncbi:MAG: hypothetical protein DMF64_03920 [Acidobacteria bacterium]|nr:MAG: hypothetical protein DMF64_03920 [Acidobacteriota bacterium]